MICKICKKELPVNSTKNGVQYFYCRKCNKSYSSKKHEPKHHIFEEYIARLLFLKCVKNKNEFTKKLWTINQIARLLGHHHRDISKWARNENLPKINKKDFVGYIEARENGLDILSVLGFGTANTTSENLNRIIIRKKKDPKPKSVSVRLKSVRFHINESEYLRLVNTSIANSKEAVFILGALLGCRTSEIIGVKYSDIDYTKNTIFFHRAVIFDKEITETENDFVTNRTYPLTKRMIDAIEWLKTNREVNKQRLGNEYNMDYHDFVCVQDNGKLFTPFELNNHTLDIREKVGITSAFEYDWYSRKDHAYYSGIKTFRFRWLRYSVKLMMLKANVSENDIKAIFDYKIAYKIGRLSYSQNPNQLDNMRRAYGILDKYIDEQSNRIFIE